ncbi:MAG: TonB-dependent receptor [Bacteroidetes bacterium]|nr:TonB-dependent receptor [Bacteroidota bacterium]HET6244851.1 TonB-dependent receptor [Bacteroidia bacterium]
MSFLRIYIIIFLFLITQLTIGQNPNSKGSQAPLTIGKISGTLIDEKSKQPVEFAAVSINELISGKIINGTITDGKGNFKLENIAPGIYVVNFSFMGYEKKSIDSLKTTPEKPDFSIGKVFLSPTVFSLKGIEIEAEASVLESKVDKIVYNADKDITSQAGDASEVLSKVPMVSVDMDGNVQLRGNSNVRILINGKPSGMMANNAADALKMIPADQIKSVEVITSPSAKYDAEGTAGIINIITKKNNIEGVTGNINATAGNRRNSLNANIGLKKGRFNLNSGVNSHYGLPPNGSTEFYREEYTGDQTRTLTQTGDFQVLRKGTNAFLNADYDINAYNSIASGIRVATFGFNRDNDVHVAFDDPALAYKQEYQRSTTNPSGSKSIDCNLDYRKTFANPKKEFFASLLYNNNIKEDNYTLMQTGQYSSLNERSFNNGFNNEFSGQLDYSHPLKEKTLLEVGVKSINRTITSDYTYEIFNNSSDSYEINYNRSNSFLYQQDVYSTYAQMGFKFKEKYELKAGGRYEYTLINGTFNDDGDSKIKNEYGNIIPSISVSRTLKQTSSLRFNYSQRIQRPGLNFLNPFINAGDPKNISYGNPLLTPELTHNFELGYAAFTKKFSLTISAFNKYTTNAIQSFVGVDSSGVTYNTFYNIGTSNSNGINLFGQMTIAKKLTARGSVNTNYMIQSGVVEGKSISNSGLQYNMNINLSYDFGKGYFGEAFLMFNSPRITLQGKVPSFSMSTFGAKKELWKKKGSIGLVVMNPINGKLKFVTELRGENFYQKNTNIVPIRAVSLTFSYKFGKIETKNTSRKGRKENKSDDLKKEDGGSF